MKNTNELNMTFVRKIPVAYLQQNFHVVEINTILRSTNNVITSSDANNKILLYDGDYKLQSGKRTNLLLGEEVNDAYLFKRRGGINTIQDIGGLANDGIIEVKKGNIAFNDNIILGVSDIISSVSLYEDTAIQFKKITKNIKNCKNSSTFQGYFASIKKYFSIRKDTLWYEAQNNPSFKLQNKAL